MFLSGIFSVMCLFMSLSMPQWLTTYESVPSTKQTPFHQNFWDLDIHIGFFSVCPQLDPLSLPDYSTMTTLPDLNCTTISYRQMGTQVTQADLGLWAPVRKTTRVVSRIR